MFWVRIRLGGREYLGVLDTGTTISLVAKKSLPCGSLKNTMTTAAIRMGDGHVVHSCGDGELVVRVVWVPEWMIVSLAVLLASVVWTLA